jgi:hypothetical protein
MQNIVFLYIYFIVATFTVFALWSLAGFGIVGNKAFRETCDMMELHTQGYKNEFVLDKLSCAELKKAGNAITEAQLGANAAVNEGNMQLNGVLLAPFLATQACLVPCIEGQSLCSL